MKLPRDRLLSSVTVRVAVMSLANVAVPLTPPAIELPSQLLPLLHRRSSFRGSVPKPGRRPERKTVPPLASLQDAYEDETAKRRQQSWFSPSHSR
jgi:hypothetical protein